MNLKLEWWQPTTGCWPEEIRRVWVWVKVLQLRLSLEVKYSWVGDRVKYTGPSGVVKADNRILLGKIRTSGGPMNAYTVIHGRSMSSGQRGEIYEVNGDQVAVIFDVSEKQTTEEDKDEKLKAQDVKPSIYWIPANEIEHDLDAQAEDCYIAMEVLKSAQPIIVYFPDSSLWLSRAVSKANRKEFVHKVQEMFDQLSGPVVLICGRNKAETGSKEKEKFPLSLKRLTEGLRATKRSVDDDIHSLFSNVMSIHPPKYGIKFLRTCKFPQNPCFRVVANPGF
ncbi:hypothetical protein FXO38_01857 [Capsicum annuum]|nr:hypothetical protein FXO38_01857 [Capsicum annuum]KAF3683849.1 hypothetical protein FXO37_01643 [Capsicum annuum]